MSATATVTRNLAQTVKEATAAEDVARKAAQAAEQAKARADAAKAAADEERVVAYKALLDLVTTEAPGKRTAALTKAGDCQVALVAAVRDGTGVFSRYLEWVDASIHVWAVDSELTQIRDFHGQHVRSVDPPAFDFARDVATIVDGIAFELQDHAVQRIRERREAFVNGRTA